MRHTRHTHTLLLLVLAPWRLGHPLGPWRLAKRFMLQIQCEVPPSHPPPAPPWPPRHGDDYIV